MIGKNVLSKKPLCLAEVGEILEERKKDGELGFEQKASLDYCAKFSKLSFEDAKGVVEDLEKFAAIDEETRIKIVDVLPVHASQVRALLQKSKIALSEGEILEVLKIAKKYREAGKG
ncbi:DNA-directed RNA polymerase subunit F [Candidatus Micrarchaeota archaeon CG11_big_fil_rev_8_21_14_0_20_47_5]|nr:MAG: hypothetical protein AUJ17_03435 [Candidatus Micrarchaeota archaeon CG1_02_47_40]PIN84295.1 MAG: DNA-directed RNA polymerase subunit F [Candidatus Micrarchaeota archaeon CG11_big_fil_rev_8_21_14_0_20_47_5]